MHGTKSKKPAGTQRLVLRAESWPVSLRSDRLHGSDDFDDVRGDWMIFWASLSIVITTMIWFVVDAQTEMGELVSEILAIIAMIMILAYFAY